VLTSVEIFAKWSGEHHNLLLLYERLTTILVFFHAVNVRRMLIEVWVCVRGLGLPFSKSM